VTSLPKTPFSNIALDKFEALDPRKQAQVQSVLGPTEVANLLNELKVQQDELRGQVEKARLTDEDRQAKVKDLREKEELVGQQVRKIQVELNDLERQLARTEIRAGKNTGKLDKRQSRRQYRESKEQRAQQLKQLEVMKETQQQEQLLIELLSALEDQANIEGELREQTRLLRTGNAWENAKAKLERQQQLEVRISKRAALLAALNAQPEWFNYVAAFVASLISTSIMHPVDTLKTREVVASVASDLNASSEPAKEEEWTLEGYLSLYKGIQAALLKEGPPSALYLGVYEAVKTQLLAKSDLAQYPLLVYLIAGALGEVVGSIVRAPSEAIKSRVQTGIDSSTGEAVKRVLFEHEGRDRVARAWSASLIRDVPFGGIQLAIFEGLKSFIINSPQSFLDIDVNTLAAEVIFGVTGGFVASLLTVPMDVVTTRILTQSCDEQDCEAKLGFAGMTKKVWLEGGWQALQTGWQTRTGYWAPAIGIFLSCYCSIRQAAIEHHLFQ
jgi:hypothetical protein